MATTNFGPDATALPDIPSAQTPKEGVVKEPVLIQGLTNIFEQATSFAKGKQKSRQDAVVADLVEKQLLLSKAYEQGGKTSAYVQTMMSKNVLDAVHAAGNNVELIDAILKAQQTVASVPGAAKLVYDGTDAENRRKKLEDEAVASGIVSPDASGDELSSAVEKLRTAKAEAERLKTRSDTLALAAQDMALTKAKRDQAAEELKTVSFSLGTTMLPLETDRMRNTFNEILASNASEADKVIAMEEYFTNLKAQSATMLIHLSSDDRNSLTAPFQMVFDTYIKRARNEYNDTQVTNEVKRITDLNELIFMSNPVLARSFTASKLLGQGPFAQALIRAASGPTITAASEYLIGTDPNNPETSKSPFVTDSNERQGLSIVAQGISAGAQSSDEELRTESVERMKRLLSSVEDYEGLLKKNKKAGVELVKWMSTKSFYKALQANPELNDNVDAAKEILQRNYSANVWELVSKKFREAKIVNPDSYFSGSDFAPPENVQVTNVPDAVTYRSTSSGMEFVALDSSNSLAVSKAKSLNEEVQPAINTTIQAMAHLEGNEDFKGLWERHAEDIMGGGLIDNIDEGDLVLSDFQQALEDAGSSGAPVGSVAEAGAGYTVVTLEDGTKEKRTGPRAWRNNNPGNIEYGPFAKAQGAVGSDGRFAVFNTYEEGRAAKKALLFESKGYASKTIQGAINRYAPDFENDSVAYAKTIARAAGVTVDTKLSDLTDAQREALLDAMERVEGFKTGKVSKL